MDKLTVRDAELKGKHVLVRVDFNVPLDNERHITDDTRIRASLPTINYLREQGAAVILTSHLGRPKGGPDPKYSLQPVANHLAVLLGAPVAFASDCIGEEAEKAAHALKPGDVLLLENVRFHPEEEKNNPEFAAQLAKLGEVYVNDAFGSAHRAHASTEGVAHYLPAYAGFLMEREIGIMGDALRDPARPFVAILGGAKVSDKMGVIANLLTKVDTLIIGGGMANTFLKGEGLGVGTSLVEEERVGDVKGLLESARARGTAVLLPSDVIVAPEISAEVERMIVPASMVPAGWKILDIGPGTSDAYAHAIKKAKTIVWNGPMGVFEIAPFAQGTLAVAEAVCEATRLGATSIVGGGDSVAALEQMGLAECVTHVSTGGGASLEFLEGRTLPGVAALLDREEALAAR